MTFRIPDLWSRYLLLALATRHKLKANRVRRWPKTTVVLIGPEDVLEEVAIELDAFQQVLAEQLEQTTRKCVENIVGKIPSMTWARWTSL